MWPYYNILETLPNKQPFVYTIDNDDQQHLVLSVNVWLDIYIRSKILGSWSNYYQQKYLLLVWQRKPIIKYTEWNRRVKAAIYLGLLLPNVCEMIVNTNTTHSLLTHLIS